MASILVLASDPIGKRMAGTAIRYWNLARVLSSEHEVTLAAPVPVDLSPPDTFSVVWFDPQKQGTGDLGEWQAMLLEQHEIVIGQDVPYYHCDPAMLAARMVIVDLYAPAILEKLEVARNDPEQGEGQRADDVRALGRLLTLGDFFICASERQRDFWLGALAGAGRLELHHVQQDPEFRNLIDVVPFGLPGTAPLRTGPGPRTSIPGVSSGDIVLVWNGGLWSWLDPSTAIRAVAGLQDEIPGLRLVFMGTQNPLSGDRSLDVVADAVQLAESLGVHNSHVFFNEWVDYDDRQNWLLDADAAITLHRPTAEARFSFRTRMLDLFWCRVPVIAARGDVLAEIVASSGIGLTVPPDDVNAVKEAIRTIADPERHASMVASFDTIADEFTWERTAKPLLTLCRNPEITKSSTERISPEQAYVHHLERQYTETAEYARQVEQALAEQQAAIEGSLSHRVSKAIQRILPRQSR